MKGELGAAEFANLEMEPGSKTQERQREKERGA